MQYVSMYTVSAEHVAVTPEMHLGTINLLLCLSMIYTTLSTFLV